MAKVETDVMYFKDDVGKNLYRKRTYYTLVVEQDVLAKDKDEADTKFTDHGGINHDKITKDIADANDGVETYMVDANYTDSDTTKYIGKVKPMYLDINGMKTLPDVIEMIKDTIDMDELESAKDYLNQLGDYLKVRDQNVLQMIDTGNKILDKLEKNKGLTDSKNDVMLVTGLYDKKKIN